MIRSLIFCLAIGLFTKSAWAQESIALPIQEPISSLVMQGAINIDQLRRPTVGELGRPEALAFEGQKTFSAEKIRRALAKDFDVVLASDAHANLRNYLRILRRRLSEGYRKAGFPEVKISATCLPKKGQIKIKIEEGPRYKNGAVVIECPDAIDRNVMTRYLTKGEAYKTPQNTNQVVEEKAEKSTPNLWKAGETADFWEKPEKVYRDAIKAGLKAQGYFYPEFEAALKPDEKGLAQLWIQVTDPGPKATIGTITVEGAKHYAGAEADILRFLGVQAGQKVGNQEILRWEQKLRDSKCFLESAVVVLPAIAPGAPSDLLIRVKEQPRGPFLGQELTERDQLMVKAADWISTWHDGDQGDLVMVIQDESVPLRLMMIASPKQGVAIDAQIQLPDSAGRLHYTISVTREKVRISSWHHERKMEFGLGDVAFTPRIALRHVEKKGDAGNWETRLNFSWGITNKNPGHPFRFKFQVDPQVAIAMSRDPDETVRKTEGVLELEKNGKVLRIDAQTGAVLSVQPSDTKTKISDLRKSMLPKPKDSGGFFYFESGAYARFAESLDRETKDFHAGHNPQRPISSSLEFLLGEAEPILRSAEKDYPIDAVSRLIRLDAIRPLDRLWIEWQAGSDEDDFSLPWSSEDGEDFRFFGLEKKLPLGLGRQLARVAYGLHGLFVPSESGPAKVGWNLALLCTGRFGQASRNLKSLHQAPEVGPLTCWYAGQLFGILDKSTGKKFAAAGLEKLDADSFRKELDHLLPAKSLLFELVGSVGNAIRQLDEDEFARLALLLGEEGKHPAVPKLARKLRQEQGTPSRRFLLEAIVTLWNIRGRDYVKARLEEIAARPVLEPDTDSEDFTLDSTDSDSQTKRKGKPKSQIK